jgi:geranylgeranyl diphosphate synthase, type II
MTFNLQNYLKEKQQLIDIHLREHWMDPDNTDPEKLHQSMHYSLFAKGKRIRPILVMASAEALKIPAIDVLPIAASLEMIHVFSLIHDDLPAMDDDDLRRGQPTNHKVYGEATAILSGDALLAQAFVPLAELNAKKYNPLNILKLIRTFAFATGTKGMIAGQMIDLESEGKKIDLERLKKLHRHKTGALIRLAVEAPAILADTKKEALDHMIQYGESIGLAFQIADDVLDIVGGEELGKDIGSDEERGKSTYPSLLGLEESKKEAQKALDQALRALDYFDESAIPLRELAKFIVNRNH